MSLAAPLLALFAFQAHAGAANELLVKNAMLVTMDSQQPEPFSGYMLVDEGGRIVEIASGDPPAGTAARTTYDARGKIVMPGFLSGHSHLWQSAFRGIAADQWVTGWVLGIHRAYGPHFEEGDHYAFTMHGALDYLRFGITTTYNYAQNLGVAQELYEEQFHAQMDAGGRFIFGYTLSAQPSHDEQLEALLGFLDRAESMPSPVHLKTSIATGGGIDQPEYLLWIAELMETYGLDVQMHYLQAPTSREGNLASFELLESAGLLSPKLVFAHYIHTNDEIVRRSGEAGAGMIWNPLSNGRLASGMPDVPAYLDAGVQVGMGIDGQASADISDPFENMRVALYGTRMRYQDATVMQPIDVLRMHTIGTAEVLGVAESVGTLTPGKYADFLVIDPTDLDTGPVSDVYATLVFASKISNLERVYVGGELLVERGMPLRHDVDSVAQDVKARVEAVAGRRDAAVAEARARRLDEPSTD